MNQVDHYGEIRPVEQTSKGTELKTIRQIADEMPETHPNKEIVEKLAAVKVAPKIKFRKELQPVVSKKCSHDLPYDENGQPWMDDDKGENDE